MSLTFTIPDNGVSPYTHRLLDLCHYLNHAVLRPFLERHEVAWEHHSTEFIAPLPGASPFEPTGTIVFQVPPMFNGQMGELQAGIRALLDKLGIRSGRWRKVQSPKADFVATLLIPILENPTAKCGPPEVNMSNAAGCLVLRDLLGYRPKQGRYSFQAKDLLERIAVVSDGQIQRCSARTVRDPSAPGRLRITQSAATAQRIRRCLEELRLFAEWATNHHHTTLQAA